MSMKGNAQPSNQDALIDNITDQIVGDLNEQREAIGRMTQNPISGLPDDPDHAVRHLTKLVDPLLDGTEAGWIAALEVCGTAFIQGAEDAAVQTALLVVRAVPRKANPPRWLNPVFHEYLVKNDIRLGDPIVCIEKRTSLLGHRTFDPLTESMVRDVVLVTYRQLKINEEDQQDRIRMLRYANNIQGRPDYTDIVTGIQERLAEMTSGDFNYFLDDVGFAV